MSKRDITEKLADVVSQLDDPGIFGEALAEIERLRSENVRMENEIRYREQQDGASS